MIAAYLMVLVACSSDKGSDTAATKADDSGSSVTDGGAGDGGAGDGGDAGSTDGGGTETVVDPGLAVQLDFALARPELAPAAVAVTWDADNAFDAITVEFDAGDGAIQSVAADADSGRQVLAGFKPKSTVEVRLVVGSGDTRLATTWAELETAALSSELPTLTVDAGASDALDGGLVLTTRISSPPAVFAVDGDGDIVWWRIFDEQTWLGRARLSHDGQQILVGDGLQPGTKYIIGVQRIGLDGELIDTVRLDSYHHDFTELPDGTLALLSNEERVVDGIDVQADQIIEVSPDGTQVVKWSALDQFEYSEEVDGIKGQEWTHGNTITYEALTDSYLVSMTGLTTVVSIDQPTGTLEWSFGGPFSDFVNTDGSAGILGFHHGVDLTEDSLVIFENKGHDAKGSGAVEYSIDPDDPLVHKVWAWVPEPSVSTTTLGNVQRLDDGTTLVNFATAGRISQVDGEGSLLWQISTSLGSPLGYAVVIDGFH